MTLHGRAAAALSALTVLAGTALLASCAASGTASSPSSPPVSVSAASDALDGCVMPGAVGPGVPIATITVRGPQSSVIPVAVLGTGPRTVVLSNQSDRFLCAWLPLVRRLTGEGYRVVLWDYAGEPPVDELRAVVAAVRGGGAGPVVLMGASKGAKTSIVAAAGLRPAVAGVVSLSAEQTLAPDVVVAPYVPELPCPLLLLTAVNDGYGSAAAAETFRAEARPGTVRLVSVPGDAHGVDLLAGPTAKASLTAVDAFLARVPGPGQRS
ncbi:alpha/beta hydrolase [Streptacidiphilus jiangxiensis]|uniref:Alpha/beta hydrolase family protein n=1 Tax=Streptacidiphilus jiangxiensis TaxID=235985 RepID=A0A1H7UNQ5_STRJI|nr:alpha/beta hydrolase [Streptacidiphilus jiangxiensis]SEL98601.1 hypothetical protein SAMN05414137_11674 [Streptacidiphilus jiangxiensis]